MTEIVPWTQSVMLTWPKTVKFYRHRFAFLEQLEDEELLAAFRKSEHDDSVGARLGDGDHEVDLHPSGITVVLYNPDPDMARVRRAVDLAVEHVAPRAAIGMNVAFQYVQPVKLDYDKARKSSAQAFMTNVGLEPEVVDWALLVDMKSQRRESLSISTEFGVVERREIGPRLSRLVGRSAGPEVAFRWDEEKFPEVALFLDASWQSRERVEASRVVDYLWDCWEVALDEGGELVGRIEQQLGLGVLDEEAARE